MKKFLTVLLLLCVFIGHSQYTSPFNQKTIDSDSSGSYSFIVSGHFYGDGTNNSRFPANSLLANLDWMNNSNASMLVCLGDLFKDISNDRPTYQSSFFDQLNMPLVNTVGNHDLSGTVYQDNYGETGFLFEVNQDIHLVIDTEQDNGDVSGAQMERLKTIREQVKTGEINNVFIYTHRTVWSDAYDEMDGLFLDNTQGLTATNFKDQVVPVLREISAYSEVFWFSGSLGTAPSSFFYFEDQENKFKIIGTAIRALPRDAVLKVNVNQGKVAFETHSLTHQELLPLESYSVDFWQTEVGVEPFNWKLIVYYMQVALTHRFFWYGVLFALFSTFFFFYIRKIWQKREFTKVR